VAIPLFLLFLDSRHTHASDAVNELAFLVQPLALLTGSGTIASRWDTEFL
jgi:hypothetical protein